MNKTLNNKYFYKNIHFYELIEFIYLYNIHIITELRILNL